MAHEVPGDRIAAVRRFTRFYTRRIGVLREGLLDSPFTLLESRVIYELAQGDGARSKDLREALDLDPGYLSRTLRGLEERGVVERRTSESDARQLSVSLTAQGRDAFAVLDARSSQEVGELLAALSPPQQERLVVAMQAISAMLSAPALEQPRITIRGHRPGDIGWVISAHAEAYALEYGWDGSFETLVGRIATGFLENFDPARERCWIATLDGQRVGSVFLVADGERNAKLRLLIVEARARGLGIGRRLVRECIAFATEVGYRRLTLWTNDILHAARRLYLEAGFQLVSQERHHSFGRELVGQYWALDLPAGHDRAAVVGEAAAI